MQADVRGPSAHADPQREGAAARVPDRAPRRLGDDRAARRPIEAPQAREPCGAEPPAGLLIGNDHQADPGAAVRGLSRRVDDRREPALHIGRASAHEASIFDHRLELLGRERRHHVVVTVQVKEPPALPCGRENRAARRCLIPRFDHLVREREPLELSADALDAFLVRAPRRVLGRDRDEVAGEGDQIALFCGERHRQTVLRARTRHIEGDH